ncbi:hypothetical protein [Rhizorhabdus sp.]|uniref:hypothetical protein n=1 Tax=Rhizorhabdus sp. TaxID=1968843 RepID=UPI001B6049F4|nr:hypothetical protein [Rhizorhabdus sp.]MBP8234409.1 hypothetical protein [Rhizorhabdus sp.]
MARPGRKRLAGARTAGGRLKASGKPAMDRGTPELRLHRAERVGGLDPVAARLWRKGQAEEAAATLRGGREHGQAVDAIGRAYLGGLLDHRNRPAEALRDAGRTLFKLYWVHYAALAPSGGLYREMVGRGAVGRPVEADTDRSAQLEAALNRRLARLDACGRDVRKVVESLCIDHHFEYGPLWLDRLLAAGRGPGAECDEDRLRLAAAITGLEAIC